jgi:hypothetical protein
MEDKREEYGSDMEIKSPIIERLSNFWYYYKWHTAVVLFIVFIVMICGLQMCSRVNTDVYIMYAGSARISRGSENGDIPAYNRLIDIIASRAEDYDKDGEVAVSMPTLTFLSPEEIEEAESELGSEVNYPLLEEDRESFEYYVYFGTSGDYYLCLISPYVFDTYSEKFSEATGGGSLFASVEPYLDADYEGYELYGASAVKLSSTALYQNSATLRSILPADTLVALRVNSALSGALNVERNNENYRRSEALMRALLAD